MLHCVHCSEKGSGTDILDRSPLLECTLDLNKINFGFNIIYDVEYISKETSVCNFFFLKKAIINNLIWSREKWGKVWKSLEKS